MAIGIVCGCCGGTESERWKFTPAVGWWCEQCAKSCDPRTSVCSLKKAQ